MKNADIGTLVINKKKRRKEKKKINLGSFKRLGFH